MGVRYSPITDQSVPDIQGTIIVPISLRRDCFRVLHHHLEPVIVLVFRTFQFAIPIAILLYGRNNTVVFIQVIEQNYLFCLIKVYIDLIQHFIEILIT